MSEELENKSELQAGNSEENSREGYRPATGNTGYRTGRSPRPRIHAQRAYVPRRTEDDRDGGFRPEGFGAGLQQEEGQQRSYRQRVSYGSQNNYQPRQNYRPRQQNTQGGYRPRYNNNEEEGGYQPRSNYQPRQQSNYRPRFNNEEDSRFRPRYYNNEEENGYQSRQNNYQPRSNYQPRQQSGGYNSRGGYQSRQQGGGYGAQRSGYQSRGGYQPRQQQGLRQRTADYDPNAKYSLKKRIEYKEQHVDPNEPIRLNKYLANAGVCSRREADDFIQAGAVTVNGDVVKELGTKVLRADIVEFNGRPVSLEKKVYVLLNKPKDYVTTSDDPQQRKTVMDLVKNVCPERIYPVGRLDRNTTGVLLLTNDGDLASKLTHPKFLKKKVYHVFLDKNVTPADIQQIAEGIELEDGEVHADAIDYASETDKSQVGIEIHSGKNRIVRRIFESLGYHVVKLDRVQFAGLTKKNLRRGDWRFLTEKEVDMLRMGAFE